MSLVGAAITPHPPIIVPEVGRGRLADVEPTVDAMRRLEEETARLRPDTIVLLSPHAPLALERMSVSLAEAYHGSLAQFGVPGVALELPGNRELAEGILRESLDREVPVQPLRDGGEGVELDHGALVPLYFLTGALDYVPSFVLLSFSLQGVAVHLDFGAAVAAAIDAHQERVLFVASGDLSHRLTPDAPAGYSPRGGEFDRQVVEAVEAGSAEQLVAIPRELVESAGECGYRSLLVLFGLLQGLDYRTQVFSYEGPFGVGYLVGEVTLGDGNGSTGEEGRS